MAPFRVAAQRQFRRRRGGKGSDSLEMVSELLMERPNLAILPTTMVNVDVVQFFFNVKEKSVR